MNGFLLFAQEHGGEVVHEVERSGGFMNQHMWLVPLLPFLSFFAILFFGKRSPGKGHAIGLIAVAAAFVISLLGFIELASGAEFVERSWTWFQFGGGESLRLELGMQYDFLCALMFVVVTFVSLLVQIYSTSYMHDDNRYTWFYAILSLFTASMLFLVIANNLIQLLVGWEGVGVCSYFLIGHFWEEKPNSSAAMKAFITTRIGDIGLMFGIFLLFFAAHTFNISEINHAAEEGHLTDAAMTIGALLLFCGAVGKSAQFPLHVWLPDAMAGPTPVSALIHAATMVVAGVYLVARMFLLFEHAPFALDVVAIIGAITMLIAAVLALLQDDIKRVLAYSTVSQLGYMMAALGVGAFTAGIFHLFTHAMFKALLFLGSGSLIHAVHSNNMSDMGGLKKYMPHTFKTFIIGSLALAGIFPLAGFWSKDEIIGSSLRSATEGSASAWIVFSVGLFVAFLTAFYMTRACVKTFWGEFRGHGEPHESDGAMVTPLWILAILSVTVGFLGIPGGVGPFSDWITSPGEEHHAFDTFYNLILPLISVAVAAAGIALGWAMYRKDRFKVDILSSPFAWAYRFVENKYYLDDLYMGGIIKPVQYPLAKAAYWFDQKVIDGVVNGVAVATVKSGDQTYHKIDQGMVDYMVNGAAGLTGSTGGVLKYIQSGNVQRYAAVLFAAIALFVAAFVIL
ncbi:MAG: NADH-quinone oxidoreductase subunit L [Actinomycetota bacterium]